MCWRSSGITWLMHRTGVAKSRLRRCRVEDTASICLVLSCHSAARNSHLNTAATESSTTRRTRPRANKRGTRRERHSWREACGATPWSAPPPSAANHRRAKSTHQVGGVLHEHAVAEGERADERRRHVRAQSALLRNQLLQTVAGERALRAYVHRPYGAMHSD